jgi:Domain of unknown function (DUF4382)
MVQRMPRLALMISVITVLGCGGGSSPVLNRFGGSTGRVALIAADQPVCDVSSFQVTITGITLTPVSGAAGSFTGGPVSILPSSQPVTVDLASLRDVSTLVSVTDVPVGTYSQITFTLSNPQLTSVDYTQSPPAPTTLAVTLPSLTVTYNINPALSVSAGGTSALRMDFDLRNSLETNTSGNVTEKATLLATAASLTAVTGTGFGTLEDLHGLVESVSTTASGSFAGTVVVQTTGLPGTSVTVNVASSTAFQGLSGGLGALLPQSFVAANAYVDSAGNIVATRITAEGLDQETLQQAAFIGEIVSVTRLNGSISQFTMVEREEFPDVSAEVPLQSLVQVNVPSSALFKVTAPENDTAQLAFDPTTVGLGQQVTVHGNYLAAQLGVPAVVNATSIYLRNQSVEGNFSKVLTVGQDGLTGGFTFTPCSGAFQGQTLSVLTFSGTDFAGVTDLNGLTTAPALLVRGQVYFEPTLTSAGTVTLAPPATILVAGKVHQLP